MYIYTNSKLLQERPSANPMTWYKNNILFQNSMCNVGESVDEKNSSGKDPIASNEPNEDEMKHNPFEFPHDDEIQRSKLLCN